MCGPMAGILSGAIGAMGAVAQYNAQVEDFNAKEAQWMQNYQNSLAAGRDQHNQLTTEAVQENAATSQKLLAYNEEGAIKAAEAETAAAGAGVTGNSVDTIIRGILGGAARNRAYARENASFVAAKIADKQRGVVAEEINRINSITRPTKPNAAAAFLNVAGAMIGGIG